ncbi:nucleoid disruption protein [Enterobacteria phage GiZh]|uniref:Nucleoid disruption protein n=2 Tax=Tequatrovirus TaxID=10663 RepID=A0A384TCN0_9CAUD|nr:Ndd-like nucleoid disruption protein [Enterobacteria phage GiZh]YP_010066671.1 Ndd-like nucleoid disruption protein [Enterobacteria phage Kha5h]ANZ51438.1 nucleoid disruption protein [Enterobacteria phage GiZh]ANZ51639.1 nucleoid disruption protein [Enterobacteria phage Kha5h]EJM7574599.1 naphthalene 1,2-dioxygenase [Escherichia coli]
MKYMAVTDLNNAGATVIGTIKGGEWFLGTPHKDILSKPGFYFLVNEFDGSCVSARFYVGNQRSKQGFSAVLSHIRQRRSQLARTIANNNVPYTVFYLPASKMKPLTTGFGKGQLALAFTRNHHSEYQTLEEMNRMLADNFKFVLQAY